MTNVLDRDHLREISCSVCKRQWFTADSDSAMTDFHNHLSGTRSRPFCLDDEGNKCSAEQRLKYHNRSIVCRNSDGDEKTFDIDKLSEQVGFRRQRWPVELLTKPFVVDGNNGIVTFCKEFRYLGSIINSEASDSDDVASRCSAARKVFGALSKKIFRNRSIRMKAKRGVYEALVLSLMLYGCESWALTNADLRRLESTHNYCVRTICGKTLWHVRMHGLSMKDLFRRSKIAPLRDWLHCRQLQWLGHIARMDDSRYPRLFLSTYVKNETGDRFMKRPIYGETISAVIKERLGTNTNWFQIAQNRFKWRSTTRIACNMDLPTSE